MNTYRPPLKNRIALAMEWPGLAINALWLAAICVALLRGMPYTIFGSVILAPLLWGIVQSFNVAISVKGRDLIVRNQLRTYSIPLGSDTHVSLKTLPSVYPLAYAIHFSGPHGRFTSVASAMITKGDREAFLRDLTNALVDTRALPKDWPSDW